MQGWITRSVLITLILVSVGLIVTASNIHAQTSGEFKRTPSMVSGRSFHTATTLADGRVLLVGGTDGNFVLTSAEIYNPATGDFTPTGEMDQSRFSHRATLLPDGRVLVTGGQGDGDHFFKQSEIYDPSTGEFSITSPTSSAKVLRAASKRLIASSISVLDLLQAKPDRT
ncbi:MAG: hypothetical protein IIB17_01895 [Chloroflexi bacterium]|nr:hypothetical protein [Chloroflexota bacterium]